ncbi:MAG TPA: tetratricopeptide repeat protein [Candidatus Omnitrophota bacterium]|nr:tetratricopeptide repeat protein [Candidatus Omnitrophota bacterium]
MFTQKFRTIVTLVLLITMTAVSMPMNVVQAETTPAGQQNSTVMPAARIKHRDFIHRIVPGNEAAAPKNTVGDGELSEDPRVQKPETKKLSAEEQKELKKIFGVAPVTSKTVTLCGGTTVSYYDKDGNLVGTFKKTTGTQYDILGAYYDKNGKLITREGTALTPEQQAALKEIFGTAPAWSVEGPHWITTSIPPSSGYTIMYYDKDGNFLGEKRVSDTGSGVHSETYYDKDGKKIDTTANVEIKPPVRPPDTETDIKVWTQYYKDYVAYINKLDDVSMKKQAWESLGNDILKLSREHPELISAGAINAVMSAMTAELKKIYRDDSYKLDLSNAQASVVKAALNLVKSDAFKAMDDATQSAIGHYFMALGVELTWLSANNKTNSALYPKIAEFFKTLLENGSNQVKAQAFCQLMNLWRIGHWGSKEGNRDEVNKILKQALNIEGGIQGLVNKWITGLDDESLDADSRGNMANALAQAIWHSDALNEASNTKLSDADRTKIANKLTAFVKGVNDGSIKVSAGVRNGMIHCIGCALSTLFNEGKGATDSTKALTNAYISFAQKSLLLSADEGGCVTIQSSAINLLTHLKDVAKAKGLEGVVEKCTNVLLDKDFDLEGFVDKARKEMNATANADHAAFVARALANIETINLANNTGKVDAKMVKETIADIKAWITVPEHLKDMRHRDWQRRLYDALTALLKQAYKKGSTLGDDKAMQENIVAIFGTISGLKDSLVKKFATADMNSLIKHLKSEGFKDLAYKIEMISCTSSEALMKKAWDYYNDKDYAAAKAFAQECIDRYGEEALKQQASLKDFAPKGQESKYWALNDVATAYFILGEIYSKQKNYEKAKEAYRTIINKFGFAQCWDPQGWYWKVADAAKKALKELP